MLFLDLIATIRRQVHETGGVELTEKHLPWARDVAMIATSARRLTISNAKLELPVALDKSVTTFEAERDAYHVYRRVSEALSLATTTILSGQLPADEQLDPRLPLIGVGIRHYAMTAYLRTKGTSRGYSRRVLMYALQGSALLIRGTLDTGSTVHVAFWPHPAGGLDADVHSFIGVKLQEPFARAVLRDSYQSGLGSMTFGPTLLVGITTSAPATRVTMPLIRGLRYYAGCAFGPNLAAAFTSRVPMVVHGPVVSREKAVPLISTPFRLTFSDTSVRDCTLQAVVKRFVPPPDEEEDDASDEAIVVEDNDVVMAQGNAVEEEEQPAYDTAAYLIGRWHGVPVWTDLPFDAGVLSWNTTRSGARVPRDPDEDAGDDDELLDVAEETFLPLTLGDIDTLLGGWSGWREHQQLGKMIGALEGLRLANAQCGVELSTRTTAQITIGLRGRALRQNVRGLTIGPCLVRLVVAQPSDPSLRTVHMSSRLRATAVGIAFEGFMRPSDFSLSLTPRQSVTLEQITGALGLDNLYTESRNWRAPAPVDFRLELGLARGKWTLTAYSEHGKFTWSS